jgi:hypothetical protein
MLNYQRVMEYEWYLTECEWNVSGMFCWDFMGFHRIPMGF